MPALTRSPCPDVLRAGVLTGGQGRRVRVACPDVLTFVSLRFYLYYYLCVLTLTLLYMCACTAYVGEVVLCLRRRRRRRRVPDLY